MSEHLRAVGDRAASFAAAFGWAEAARVAGSLHDIGKCSKAFQDYLRQPRVPGGPRGPDHSTAGALEARAAFPKSPQLGRLLGAVIAGHHGGLMNITDLDARLDKKIEPYDGWRKVSAPLPEARALVGRAPAAPSFNKGFEWAFLIRMLFSCLVDADFLETERAVTKAEGRVVERGGHAHLENLAARLRDHMASMRGSTPTPVNALRAEVLDHCIASAPRPPGLFTLTVPTGGGKTLASLSFALEHALRHGMRRVVYVVPFTSIIEQTASVFRQALGTTDDVLEHHVSFDWDGAKAAREDGGEGPDGIAKLRRAEETWDVPVVVTTAVQFFESLFANRTSRCRKLHNLANAVIVLDEAQTLPLPLLRPCMATLDQLARNYGASVVLCTATQPALRIQDGFNHGFEMDADRELAPDPPRLYQALRRVAVERLDGKVEDTVIADRFAEQDQMLCIVNTRGHAQALFDAIRPLPGATHLTTLMCPRHRRAVLEGVRQRLRNGAPVRLVATSLIEAGVDVDFPEVWRAVAGLESIAQAAGRCNREGGLGRLGRVVIFDPADARPLRELEANWQAARQVLRRHDDPLSPDTVRAYFNELYWQKGDAAMDAKGIMRDISDHAGAWTFPFETIAEKFRMIEDIAEPVIVPWDKDAETLLARIAGSDRASRADLRHVQQYIVGIPRRAREQWFAQGVLQPVRRDLGEALLRFADLAHYDDATGVNLHVPEQRAAVDNIFDGADRGSV